MKEKILILDFDGVIINGIEEYWFTCCRACDKLLDLPINFSYEKFNKTIPQKFINLRPLVTKGWEMVILAFAIIFLDDNWDENLLFNFENNFQLTCKSIANRENFDEEFLQNHLDMTRQKIIDENMEDWISKHKLFDEIKNLLLSLNKLKINYIIISSKNSKFLKYICPKFELKPIEIFGYEHGTKVSILKKLNKKFTIVGFIEDRKEALEEVIMDRSISNIPCFFADWGYNLKEDQNNLNNKISIITLKTLGNLTSVF